MKRTLLIVATAFKLEMVHLSRSPLLVSLTLVQAITFLFLVSLFGMTGANAPTAIIDNDRGGRAQAFIEDLRSAHNSFSLVYGMDEKQAMDALQHGNLVAAITIPQGFSRSFSRHRSSDLKVVVDNIDTDMTEDIQRALPSAIVAFGRRQHLPYCDVTVEEKDLIDHDTDFVKYMIASSLVLAALIISCTLTATSVAREYQNKTAALLVLSPVHPLVPLAGRLLANSCFSSIVLAIPLMVAVLAFGIIPVNLSETLAALITCAFTFACMGASIGTLLRHTMPVVPLVFGISLALFMISGSYEPERFDGNLIWSIAHFSPVYYGVGIIEQAVHGLTVTPEPLAYNWSALIAWAFGFLLIAALSARQGVRQ